MMFFCVFRGRNRFLLVYVFCCGREFVVEKKVVFLIWSIGTVGLFL